MNYGSVCSGIEAASVAWHPLGWKPAWFAEIEPFPSAVLAHHWPEVPNLGDFTAIRHSIAAGELEAPDVLVGGTPCQAFSVAGLRQSLDDKRGQLTLEFVRLANAIDSDRSLREKRPVTVVWENVPGVLNTPDNAFGCFLAGLVGEDDPLEPPGGRWTNVGYVRGPRRAVAWRILDAQYFGVAQRRRRVFVVASARSGVDPREILFEFDGMRRDSAPRREAGQGFAAVAGTLAASGGGMERPAGNANELDFCVPVNGSHWDGGGQLAVAVDCFKGGQGSSAGGIGYSTETAPTLTSADSGNNRTPTALVGMQVRRLTPTECERLQGFPDGHTKIPWRGKPADECPDGPRYKALGNSMAVPVMRWIGERVALHAPARSA